MSKEVNMNFASSKNLTKKQIEVAKYVAKGFTDKEIASLLGCSVHTVKSHLKDIYRRLNVSGRAELAGQISKRSYPCNNIPIDGYWLSKFEYSAFNSASNKYISFVQFNLEVLRQSDFGWFNYIGENVLSASSRGSVFQHKLKCRVNSHQLLGMWENVNTRNSGCFQLLINNNGKVMHGLHLGNASDNTVQSGSWLW